MLHDSSDFTNVNIQHHEEIHINQGRRRGGGGSMGSGGGGGAGVLRGGDDHNGGIGCHGSGSSRRRKCSSLCEGVSVFQNYVCIFWFVPSTWQYVQLDPYISPLHT
mmetsp:Transcript_6532/g.8829  ORF Transcript_6532/g.8829 Transcript_6532/m.8829 type:complete len:106 (+) Transcript_6532:256-573(+)